MRVLGFRIWGCWGFGSKHIAVRSMSGPRPVLSSNQTHSGSICVLAWPVGHEIHDARSYVLGFGKRGKGIGYRRSHAQIGRPVIGG